MRRTRVIFSSVQTQTDAMSDSSLRAFLAIRGVLILYESLQALRTIRSGHPLLTFLQPLLCLFYRILTTTMHAQPHLPLKRVWSIQEYMSMYTVTSQSGGSPRHGQHDSIETVTHTQPDDGTRHLTRTRSRSAIRPCTRDISSSDTSLGKDAASEACATISGPCPVCLDRKQPHCEGLTLGLRGSSSC